MAPRVAAAQVMTVVTTHRRISSPNMLCSFSAAPPRLVLEDCCSLPRARVRLAGVSSRVFC